MTDNQTREASPTAVALVAAAVQSTPPPPAGDPAARAAWLAEVAEIAIGLYRHAQAVDAEIALLAACTPITGVVLRTAEVSGRGVITLRPTMGTAADDPSATEEVRTPWLNEARGAALLAQAAGLVGREVRIGKYYEKTRDARNVRMCAWIEAMGPAKAPAPVAPKSSPPRPTTEEPTPQEPTPQGERVTTVAAMREMAPSSGAELGRMAFNHLGLEPNQVRDVSIELLGPPGPLPRTAVQLARVWNELVTLHGEAAVTRGWAKWREKVAS